MDWRLRHQSATQIRHTPQASQQHGPPGMSDPPPAYEDRVGTLVDHKYRIVRVVGTGGMGCVYEAENTWTRRRVAIKFLHRESNADPEIVRRSIAWFRFHVVVASDRANTPKTCNTFLGSREVEDERERSFPALAAWRHRWPEARIRASTNSLAAQLELVRAGVGAAILPEFLVQRDIAEGRLVAPLSGHDAVFPLLNPFSRIPVCGLIADYNTIYGKDTPTPPWANSIMRAILVKRLNFRGFIVRDFEALYPDFIRDMSQWVREGKVKYKEFITEGLESAPQAFMGLLKGANFGKQLVRVGPDKV